MRLIENENKKFVNNILKNLNEAEDYTSKYDELEDLLNLYIKTTEDKLNLYNYFNKEKLDNLDGNNEYIYDDWLFDMLYDIDDGYAKLRKYLEAIDDELEAHMDKINEVDELSVYNLGASNGYIYDAEALKSYNSYNNTDYSEIIELQYDSKYARQKSINQIADRYKKLSVENLDKGYRFPYIATFAKIENK